MLKKSKQLGFTLIELLVVIAIIGVLASIILVALNSARTKGNDAKIKANLSNLRAGAEVLYDSASPQQYAAATADTCSGVLADSSLVPILTPSSYAGSPPILCRVSTQAYAVSIRLGNNTSTYSWCVDSQGLSMQISGNLAAADTTCN